MTTPTAERRASGGESRGEPRQMLLVVDVRTSISVVITLLAAFALFAVARAASAMITLVAIGVVLALALDGVVRHLTDRFEMPRPVAVVCVAIGLFVVATAVMLLLGPPAIDQARDLGSRLPETVREFYDLPLVGGWIEDADLATRVEGWIADLPSAVSTDTITSSAESLFGGAVAVLVVVATTFSVLLDGERLVAIARRALPARHRNQADRVGRVFYQVVGRYFGGSLTVAAMMGIYVLTIALVFGVPLAPLAAIWAMFTDLIPQIGGLLGGAFLAILALAAGPGTAIIVVVLFVLYMNLENHVIQPAVVGNAVNLSPPTTMLAALIGGAAAGVPGALVATPLVGAVKQLYVERRHPGTVAERTTHSLRDRLKHLLRRGK